MICNYCIILYLHEREWWRIYCIINPYWIIIYVNSWQISSKYELLNLFHIMEHIENVISVAHRGKSKRTLVHKDDQPWVSVGPRPYPPSLGLKWSLSQHTWNTFPSHYLWSTSFQAEIHQSVWKCPQERRFYPSSWVKFFFWLFLRFCYLNSSQISLISNCVLV